jgi:hypothetical protein
VEIEINPSTMNRTAITTTGGDSGTYRWRTTTKGGYRESYVRVGLTVNVDNLYKLVNMLFTLAK